MAPTSGAILHTFPASDLRSAALVSHVGNDSLIIISALSAIFDVDVAILSALRVGGEALPLHVVAGAVLAAVAANAEGRVLVAALSSATSAYWLTLAAISMPAAGAGAGVFPLLV